VTNFFRKQFYQSISKTVGNIEKKNRIKFADLLFYNNLLAGHILIPPTVFEIQGFEVRYLKNKNKIKKLTPNFREILP